MMNDNIQEQRNNDQCKTKRTDDEDDSTSNNNNNKLFSITTIFHARVDSPDSIVHKGNIRNNPFLGFPCSKRERNNHFVATSIRITSALLA